VRFRRTEILEQIEIGPSLLVERDEFSPSIAASSAKLQDPQ
jgi:hypothetical protein